MNRLQRLAGDDVVLQEQTAAQNVQKTNCKEPGNKNEERQNEEADNMMQTKAILDTF